MVKKKKDKVFIVFSDRNYERMFLARGWALASSLRHATLIQFTGGSDVSPYLYGQHTHNLTWSIASRDWKEILIFRAALKLNIPMAGICRGGQFLNVMCGGSLWQHVENHTHDHLAWDMFSEKEVPVTSTHHQMMIPAHDLNSHLILMETSSQSNKKEKMTHLKSKRDLLTYFGHKTDLEALYYYQNLCLCFQPHPEYGGHGELTDVYFDYINNLF